MPKEFQQSLNPSGHSLLAPVLVVTGDVLSDPGVVEVDAVGLVYFGDRDVEGVSAVAVEVDSHENQSSPTRCA